MPAQPDSIKVGLCYAVENQDGPAKPDQHRRVVAINGGKVSYESWGGGVGYPGGTLFRNEVDLDKFAQVVKGEVPCPINLPPLP